MCLSAFVCLSVIVRSLKHGVAHSSVHVVVCDSLCVYRGVPLQGRWRGAWPWGHSSNSEALPYPSVHSGLCWSIALKLNERSPNNSRRQVISLFKY